MDVELRQLVAALWRRRWIVVAVLVIGVGTCAGYLATRKPTYEARVRIQLLPPREEESLAAREGMVVRLQDTIDDLMTVTRNNFIEVLKSGEVGRRARARLGAAPCAYGLDVEVVRDSNFLDLVVWTPCREQAAVVTNLLADEAIARYVELRGLGLAATRAALRTERATAGEALQAAEQAFAAFRSERGVGSITDAIRTSQETLTRLELERDRRNTEASAGGSRAPGDGDRLVARARRTVAELIALEPAYRVLEERVEAARRALRHVSDRYAEAELRGRVIQAASFMQRVEEAHPPEGPRSRGAGLLMLAAVGSLGVGIVLAVLVDFLFAPPVTGSARPS